MSRLPSNSAKACLVARLGIVAIRPLDDPVRPLNLVQRSLHRPRRAPSLGYERRLTGRKFREKPFELFRHGSGILNINERSHPWHSWFQPLGKDWKLSQAPGLRSHHCIGPKPGQILSCNNQKVDDFNTLVMEIFNLAKGNMLQKGTVLTWNVGFDARDARRSDRMEESRRIPPVDRDRPWLSRRTGLPVAILQWHPIPTHC